MEIRESNVIMFKQSIDSKRKEGVTIAKQFLEKIDGLNMNGLRREPARLPPTLNFWPRTHRFAHDAISLAFFIG